MRLLIVTCSIVFFGITLFSCSPDPSPKPKGELRLDYPKNNYKKLVVNSPFSFDINQEAKVEKSSSAHWYNLRYPKMKATLHLSYFPINGNLKKHITDSEKLAYKHLQKATAIQAKDYLNPDNEVYGKLYQIKGNVASNLQFYATDSLRHFIAGSLYFYASPNADSLAPAVKYIRKDIIRLFETLEWMN